MQPTATWHRSPAAIGIIIAMRELNALHDRLGAVDTSTFGNVSEARSFIGRYGPTYTHTTWNRGFERIVAPETNCSAIGQLWDALDALRDAAIDAQQVADGFRVREDHAADENDLNHHREINDATLSVADAIASFGRTDALAEAA